MTGLDNIDRQILRELKLDARQSSRAIAARVGLSASACHRRVKLLEEGGVIRGYTLAGGSADGEQDQVTVIVQVTLEGQAEKLLLAFEVAVRRLPEVRQCYLMTGVADYWLRIEVADAAAYEALHGEVLSRLPGVTRIHSSFALRDAVRPRSKRSHLS